VGVPPVVPPTPVIPTRVGGWGQIYDDGGLRRRKRLRDDEDIIILLK
jgi:hypothetical protein